MFRVRGGKDDDIEDEEYEDEDQFLDDKDYDEDVDIGRGRGTSSKKWQRSDFIDDVAEEDDEDDEEDDDELYGGGGKKHSKAPLETGADLPDEDVGRRMHCHPLLLREDQQEDVEALEISIQASCARSTNTEYDEETTDVEQQALLPSVRDPKLRMVKCVIGHERETAACLMQKYIDKGSELQI
ncbi:hypothetical protein Golob_011447, partial [Gossypium lobatum]|nr:hypothetical protein [Gossypium lobatum]